MGLHHAKKGAAVKKYGPLVTEGKSEADIKAEIVKDDALAPYVDEVYAAITAGDVTKGDNSDSESLDKESDASSSEQSKAKKAKGHVVISEFRDKNDFSKRYKVGDDVSHFDESRKTDLVNRKLIKAV